MAPAALLLVAWQEGAGAGEEETFHAGSGALSPAVDVRAAQRTKVNAGFGQEDG